MSGDTSQTGCRRHSVEITNRSESSIMVYVEPWGDEFSLQPMEQIRVDIIGPVQKAIPISHLGESIVVEGWEGTNVEVWKGEERLN